jgi:DNA-binding transcriptional regulator YiaG
MPRKYLPRIASVAAGKTPLTLLIQWENGSESCVDVSGLIATFRVYEPLRCSMELFRTVRVGDLGTDVCWTDEIDMAADTLWRLAQEQSGQTMSADAFRNWRERKALTLDTAAVALGLSRRMVAYYEQGEKPIPRVVALATLALDSLSPE